MSDRLYVAMFERRRCALGADDPEECMDLRQCTHGLVTYLEPHHTISDNTGGPNNALTRHEEMCSRNRLRDDPAARYTGFGFIAELDPALLKPIFNEAEQSIQRVAGREAAMKAWRKRLKQEARGAATTATAQANRQQLG